MIGNEWTYERKVKLLEANGWFRNDMDWWHPPSCLASWPLDRAWQMCLNDIKRDSALAKEAGL
jgi:hypothetical protein